MSRALVVGGTGMLAQATRELARRGHEVTCIARSKQRLDALSAWADGEGYAITGASLDYGDDGALASFARAHGRFDLGLFWIHSSAPRAPEALAALVHGPLFHVLGSAAGAPDSGLERRRATFESIPSLTAYHPVILGFEIEDGRSRWLTDGEISAGAIAALDAPSPLHVVGRIEPWELKP